MSAKNLLVVRAPPNTPPIQSKTRVRQGKLLGPFLFAHALQQLLEHTRNGAPNVEVIALTNNASLDGCIEDLKVALQI